MADITIDVLEPATSMESRSFLSLKEAKLLLGLDEAAGPHDELLTMQIAISSDTIMRCCNRMMAKQKVSESWRRIGNGRLFLTHYPVKIDDIESVTAGRDERDDWELEQHSGKLSHYLGWWFEPVTVVYSGGFALPDEAPLPLKQACLLLLRHARQEATREAIEGIRMIGHKESRVMFFDPSAQQKATVGAGGTMGTGVQTVDQILAHYMRIWV
jgi:hypothetical protein